MTRVLVIDNYDSFVHTLAGYLQQLGADVTIMRNDELAVDAAAPTIAPFDAVLISPGPGRPATAGVSTAVVLAAAAARKPLLGVCLGHQVIAEAFGAEVVHAGSLMHGKTSQVMHDGGALYAGVPSPFTATRYHSLAIAPETVPDTLLVTCRALPEDDGEIMGVRHRDLPIEGVQFHPESVLTEAGYLLLGNWLAGAGLADAPRTALGLAPLAVPLVAAEPA